MGQFCISVPAGMGSDISVVLGSVSLREDRMNKEIKEVLKGERGRHWGSSPRGQEKRHSSISCQTLAQCMDKQRDYVNTGLTNLNTHYHSEG